MSKRAKSYLQPLLDLVTLRGKKRVAWRDQTRAAKETTESVTPNLVHFCLKLYRHQWQQTTEYLCLSLFHLNWKGPFFSLSKVFLETLISFTKMKKISYSNCAILTYPSQEKKLFHAWHAFVYRKTVKCLHVIKTCIWANILNYIKGML